MLRKTEPSMIRREPEGRHQFVDQIEGMLPLSCHLQGSSPAANCRLGQQPVFGRPTQIPIRLSGCQAQGLPYLCRRRGSFVHDVPDYFQR
jgi:hypothetical protein